MENLVILFTQESFHSDITSETTNYSLYNLTNEVASVSQNETIDLGILDTNLQLDRISVSPCSNYVAAINGRSNELMVYSMQNGNAILPPIFTSTLNLQVNDCDNRKITGWDKTALGQYHGIQQKENAALLQNATTPFLDPGIVNISWSRFENLEQIYLCVNAYTKDLKRYLALFNISKQRLDGTWHEMSMDHKIGQAIAWRPRCNQLAVPFQSGDSHYIGIWERGALIRGIQLGINDIPVAGLEFSDDGVALYVWQQMCSSEEGDERGGAYISVYLYANGGWMRKQQFHSIEQLLEVKWACTFEESVRNIYTMKMIKYNNHVSLIQWGLRPDVSKDGEIVVINGNFIDITLMNEEVLPPGTCSLQLELPLPSITANQVFLHDSKPIIAVLCDRMLVHFYDRQTGTSLFGKAVNIKNFSNSYCRLIGEWFPTVLLDDLQECEHFRLRDVKYKGIAICIESDCKKKDCLEERERVISIPYELGNNGMLESENEVMRQMCSMDLNGTFFTFKLDFKGCFYINKDLVSKEINSLCLHSGYIFATAYKTLYYFHGTSDNIAAIIQKCHIEFGNNGPSSTQGFTRYKLPFIYQRPIEVQAKLLTGSIGGLVLVMHRGNFELLQISQICSDIVAKLMDERKFKKAVSVVHLMNLDPNVLIDANIEGFISNADDFVKEVSDQSLIHLLISLNDEAGSHQTKRSRICHALRTVILPTNGRFLPNHVPMIALTSLQATNPPNPVGAMMDINSFLKVALKSGMDETLVLSVVDNTLRALQAACGKEMKWFEYALRVSDEQELARMVADVSRMDPRVYEPFLQDLSKYKDKFLYYHHVYKFLGENDKALLVLLEWFKKRLNADEDTEMVLEFIFKKHLHRRTMDILINAVANGEQETCNINTLILKLIHVVASELLVTQDRTYMSYATALVDRIIQPNRAVEVYGTHKTNYNITIPIATLTPNTVIDPEEIVSTLVKDGQYSAAVSLARTSQRKDLIDTVICQGISERTEILTGQIKELSDRFIKMYNRLQQVRADQAERIPKHYPHADEENGKDVFDDTASMATTTMSTSVSISTNASSNKRRQRRAARKQVKLREGHPRENINLVRALHEDVQWVFGLTQVMTEFYEISISDPYVVNPDTKSLIRTTLQLQSEMTEKVKAIWPEEINHHLDPLNPRLSEAQIKHIVALQNNWNYLEMVCRTQPANMQNVLKTISSEKQ